MSEIVPIAPGRARALVLPHADTRVAGTLLLDRAAAGLLNIYAEKTIYDPPRNKLGERSDQIVMYEMVDQFVRQRKSNTFWDTGSVRIKFTAGKDVANVSLIGMYFDERDISKIAGEHALPEPLSPSRLDLPTRSRDTGGRSSSKHGTPIAIMALRYAQLSLPTLNRMKAISLQDDLIALYNEFGVEPPKGKNLEGICGGILHALRDPEMRRTWQP